VRNSDEFVCSNDPRLDPEMPNIRDDDMVSLNVASRALEESLEKMEKREMQVHSEMDKPIGLIPTTHEAIHRHSSRAPQATWLWITKSSTVDKDGRLGFPATREEIRRFGATTRKVFIHKPPSVLQKSFAQAVSMGREEDHPSSRPWKRRGENGSQPNRAKEDRDPQAKWQQGGGAQSQMGYNRGNHFQGGQETEMIGRDAGTMIPGESELAMNLTREVGGMTMMEIKAGWKSRLTTKCWTRGIRPRLSNRWNSEKGLIWPRKRKLC
jgi:hypothetical protein